MSIPNKQIGWSNESNLLWQVAKQLDRLVQITFTSSGPSNLGTNGTTPYKLISTSSTNANVVKASGGNLYSIIAIGLGTSVAYLKFYNKETAPIVGTDIPVMTIPIPTDTQGAGVSIPFSIGVNFPLGIALAITAGAGDSDDTIILADEVIINLTYA